MNKSRILRVPTLFLLGTLTVAPVSAATIDFEGLGLAVGTSITNQVPGVTISASGGIGEAWLFDTGSPTGGDGDLGAPFSEIDGGPTISPGNVLIVQENDDGIPDDLAGSGGMLNFVFDVATTLFSIDFFDMEEDTTIQLFSDSFVTQIGGDFLTDDSDTGNSTPNKYEHLVFNGADGVSGVKSIRIDLEGSGAIDNITHRMSVPEPATLWLFGSAFAGFAGLGYRRRKRLPA
jgi:hypothetical protein